MTHAECVHFATAYLVKRYPVVLPEFYTWNSELPDVLGFKSNMSCVVEVKVSRSDFLSDAKKPFRVRPDKGMGDVRYYCCPRGLISKDELPRGWGLLYVYENGGIREIKDSAMHVKNMDAEYHALYYYARRAFYAGVHSTVLKYRGVN